MEGIIVRWPGGIASLAIAMAMLLGTSGPGWADETGQWQRASEPLRTVQQTARDGLVRQASGSASSTTWLSGDAGQQWREYGIEAFTRQAPDVERPEQQVVDWILRETGTDAWFTGAAGVLHADRQRLRVYHTPEVQQKVAEIVERFVAPQNAGRRVAVRLVTIGHPDWRLRGLRVMQPVEVRTPGVEAWLMAKEDAAVLLAELRRRTDFREHTSASLSAPHGLPLLLEQTRPRNYAKSIRLTGTAWPGYELQRAEIYEGYRLTISPLFSVDTHYVEAVIQCQVDQIEKLDPLWIDVPTAVDPRQRVQIQVPQMASWQLVERFRWPADKVLLISRGLVATPDGEASGGGILPIPLPFTERGRADALLMLEPKGPLGRAETAESSAPAARVGELNRRGRY